jgi:crotonobetainyl-CoA:carnitine CoA-transferase CaiB-like acyl-CoA transferase
MLLSLQGIRVIDLTDSIVGPFTTMLLGSCGAEVIRVESRNHLGFRASGPWRSNVSSPVPSVPESQIDFSKVDINLLRGPLFSQLNYNKLSISLNLTRPEGKAIFEKLAKVSDVVVENFRFGVMQKWGFDYPSLQQIKKDIIVANMEAFGRGPYESWTTWGMNLLSYSGFTHWWGHPDTPETERAASGYHGDYVSGAGAAVAILAALLHRASTGEGQYLELSQAEATASVLAPYYLDYFVNHRIIEPRGNRHPQFAPYNCYRCKGDDRWCVIAVFNESDWKAFCSALESPNWTQDPKFQDMASRLKNVSELDRHIEAWTKVHTPHQVMNLLQTFGVPAGAVQNGEDLYYDLQLRERGYMTTQDIPRMGSVTFSGTPFRLSEGQIPHPLKSPVLGEHNEYVFRQLLGLGQKEISDLTESKVIY